MRLACATFALTTLALTGCAAPAQAPVAGGTATEPAAGQHLAARVGAAARRTYDRIAEDGTQDVYASGYARHGHHTYTAQRRAELNQNAWGGGFGKTLRDGRGNEESLFALAISDSHRQPQLTAGYARQWIWPLAGSGLDLGVGYAAMLMSRQDTFGGFPFPAVLPIASVGTRRVRLMASYVPRLSSNKGNGDVLLLFVRFSFE